LFDQELKEQEGRETLASILEKQKERLAQRIDEGVKNELSERGNPFPSPEEPLTGRPLLEHLTERPVLEQQEDLAGSAATEHPFTILLKNAHEQRLDGLLRDNQNEIDLSIPSRSLRLASELVSEEEKKEGEVDDFEAARQAALADLEKRINTADIHFYVARFKAWDEKRKNKLSLREYFRTIEQTSDVELCDIARKMRRYELLQQICPDMSESDSDMKPVTQPKKQKIYDISKSKFRHTCFIFARLLERGLHDQRGFFEGSCLEKSQGTGKEILQGLLSQILPRSRSFHWSCASRSLRSTQFVYRSVHEGPQIPRNTDCRIFPNLRTPGEPNCIKADQVGWVLQSDI
jgi:hypothetical protein